MAESRKDLSRYIIHNTSRLLKEFDSLSNMMASIYAKQERKKTPPGRRDDIISLWGNYLESIATTSTWTGADVILNEPFYTMINAPSGAPINDETVGMALAAFADHHVPTTLDQLSLREASMLDIGDTAAAPHAYSINSAATVFSCVGCQEQGKCIIGWNMAFVHYCNEDCFGALFEDHPFRIHEAGCFAALSLMKLLDMDPKVTLPEHLDDVDPHLICMTCFEGGNDRRALSWRECHPVGFPNLSDIAKVNHRAVALLKEEKRIRSMEWKVPAFRNLQLLLDQPYEILFEVRFITRSLHMS
ncbi:hypothetical protein H0H87_007249 [Tephrocybe sp. NHM501043]|nr:hypothetical protein H0H87_007249 [Tephrocybe sp. NHM501043]